MTTCDEYYVVERYDGKSQHTDGWYQVGHRISEPDAADDKLAWWRDRGPDGEYRLVHHSHSCASEVIA